MKEEKNACESLPGSRCTRSRAAPDWTLTESLILVNEIAAVEADCLRALSSYQQWKMIAENCAVLDVGRGLNQCRTKWNSLLAEYSKIKAWQSKSPRKSYWSLESERAKKSGLPENFDHELFKAIDDLVKARNERWGTDPESDFEAEAEELDDDVIEETGPKRKGRWFKSKRHAQKLKNCLLEESLELSKGRHQRDYVKERPEKSQEPEKNHVEEDHLKDLARERANSKHAQEKPSKVDMEMSVKSLAKGKLQEAQVKERPSKTIGKEENDEMLALKLQELAEQVLATSTETADCRTDCSQNVEAYRTEFTRRQGDKLIASLGDLAHTLKQLCNLLHECK
ncbi:trihelix transcription factor ASR3-like [Neltuma alba]|uniref:trihelix transcription factor ASR3 n=1 Tax=Neltuma alba TaxID=207710 RepID=UPI0010A51619|nr:trihelix transcription factor ASR3 [Prosopis alba]XP_028793864.1 trihelix transcription factor ASR3-like [Prosopis alba]